VTGIKENVFYIYGPARTVVRRSRGISLNYTETLQVYT